MKHVAPQGKYTDGFVNVAWFTALAMMEINKDLLIELDETPNDRAAGDIRMHNVKDNLEPLTKYRDALLEGYTPLAIFWRVKDELPLSTYAQLAIEAMIDSPAMPQLLAMDLRNAIKEGIIRLRDGQEIGLAHLKLLYPNGFYNTEGYRKRVEEYESQVVTELVG